MIDDRTEAIIFDFGGVIINIDYNATIKAFEALGIDNFDELFSKATQSNLFDDIETGKISPQHFINRLLTLLPEGTSPNRVVHAWNAMLMDIPKDRIELLLRLKERYKIFLLSNTNLIHIDSALRTWNATTDRTIDSIFDHVYFSHEMGLRKPHVEIFETVCREQGLNPDTTLFIDDSIQHIEGAQKAGLNTFHLSEGLVIQDVFS